MLVTSNRPTLRDVAARAGVSHQTVSRVINGDVRVSTETRQKVQTAIDALGYRPNAIARSMARGRSNTLACLSPNLTDYTFASIIEAAEAEARQHGLFLLSTSAPDEKSFGALLDQLVAGRRVDGLLVINPYIDGRYTRLIANFPCVFIGAQAHENTHSSISLNDENAALQAVQHLLGLGHQRIALITGPHSEECVQDRNTGYQLALRQAGLALDSALSLEGDWSASSGYEATMHLSRLSPPPTAIFAQNDRMALGALRAARDLGWRVPEQLAVVGIDDMPLASYFDPPLTTMRQNMAAIGREATRLLLQAIDYPSLPSRQVRLPAELIIRRSTQLPSI